MALQVKAWTESITIPTYPIGAPEKYPMFFEKRVYQGSSGAVYPHPVIEKIYDDKTDQVWKAFFLENDFLRIMILPELGGRVQMAYDKIKKRHFVYYNQVIKPALVGLTGPWISGGIEFNWPQHHRPTTYEPVDSAIEQHEDGSKTVWVNEIEQMFGTKGKAGFRLHPDKAYLEIDVALYNRTPFPQTFLWWANPAVKVNDHYQSVFPPDVQAVFDHGKRDVSRFPIAKGTYYKVDYSAGVDISRYKNIPVPTSYMAVGSQYDFVGGYEHDSGGGLLHVANHHVSPGKKQWTWGNGNFGRAWDRNLTDEDGPYIELMCGVYTDNQPDFSWLNPYEEKTFTQYFLPYQELGRVKNANQHALINLELEGQTVMLSVYTTGFFAQTRLMLFGPEEKIWEDQHDFAPGSVYQRQIPLTKEFSIQELRAVVLKENQRELIAWQALPTEEEEIPEPASAVLSPQDVPNNELLYLNGLHLEQYRHATYDPTDYYQEALRRDPGDIRNNTAMGLWLLRKAQFEQAAQQFVQAIKTLTSRNPNPYQGEPFYWLGICRKMQGRSQEAYDALYKATWNAAWQSAAFFHLAQIDAQEQQWETALAHVEKSLIVNSHHHQARHLKAIILRKTDQFEAALAYTESSLALDLFNLGALYEKYLITQHQEVLDKLLTLARNHAPNLAEFALDYAHAGCYQEAKDLILLHEKKKGRPYPLLHYLQGWFAEKAGDHVHAKSCFDAAASQVPDFGFPNRLDDVLALQQAIKIQPRDRRAHYFLGNFFYAHRQPNAALVHWEEAAALQDDNPITYRNLALVYFNKLQQPEKAVQMLEKAFEMDNGSARLLMELDQLYKRLNRQPQERLALLEKYPDLVEFRDDLYLEKIALLNTQGQNKHALTLLGKRQFHPWEGGEGKVPAQYLYSHIALAYQHLAEQRYQPAYEHLMQAQSYPQNLGEGKLFGTQENDVFYWLGCAEQGLGNLSRAIEAWEKASTGLTEPEPAIFYNDQQPDKIFYQGLALLRLNRQEEARTRFNKLIAFGQQRMTAPVKIDYFAVSLPDLLLWDEDLQARNTLFCHYLIGLGNLGLGNTDKAIEAFTQALQIDTHHQGLRWHYQMANKGKNALNISYTSSS